MKFEVRIFGINELEDVFREFPKKAVEAVQVGIRVQGRQMAIDLLRSTAPIAERGRVKLEARIASEIKRLYPTMEDSGAVYEVIKRKAPHLAAPFWAAIKRGQDQRAARIVGIANVRVAPYLSVVNLYRTDVYERVPEDAAPIGVVRPAQQARIIRLAQQKVGMAKAGWYQAAQELGGRVRGGGGASGGTYQLAPEFVRKVSMRHKGKLGGATYQASRHGARAELRNRVRYADGAMISALMHNAELRTYKRFNNWLKIRLEKLSEQVKRRRLARGAGVFFRGGSRKAG